MGIVTATIQVTVTPTSIANHAPRQPPRHHRGDPDPNFQQCRFPAAVSWYQDLTICTQLGMVTECQQAGAPGSTTRRDAHIHTYSITLRGVSRLCTRTLDILLPGIKNKKCIISKYANIAIPQKSCATVAVHIGAACVHGQMVIFSCAYCGHYKGRYSL